MSRDEFFDAYHGLKERFPTSSFIIHFRWATGGGVQTELCHPFPIDNRRRVLLARRPANVRLAVAHNGVISNWSGMDETVSDTFLYVKNVLYPAFRDESNFLLYPAKCKRIAEE